MGKKLPYFLVLTMFIFACSGSDVSDGGDINSLPTAADDSATAEENTTTNISVTNNDDFGEDGPDAGTIIVPSATTFEGGSIVVNDGGTPTDPTD